MFSAQDTAPSSWRQCHLMFKDPTDADTANWSLFTVDIANITNGAIDATWNDGDYTAVEAELSNMILQLLPYLSPRMQHFERRYYIRNFNEVTNPKPFSTMGPPER